MIIGHPQIQSQQKLPPPAHHHLHAPSQSQYTLLQQQHSASHQAPRFLMQNKPKPTNNPTVPPLNFSPNSTSSPLNTSNFRCSNFSTSSCPVNSQQSINHKMIPQAIQPPLAPLNQQNFRNQAVNLLNCTNNFILNNDCNQIYIETGYIECPFHLKRTEWYEISFTYNF